MEPMGQSTGWLRKGIDLVVGPNREMRRRSAAGRCREMMSTATEQAVELRKSTAVPLVELTSTVGLVVELTSRVGLVVELQSMAVSMVGRYRRRNRRSHSRTSSRARADL